MQFKRIDLTTSQRVRDRKKFLIAGKVTRKIFTRGFTKTFEVEGPTRVIPDLTPDTVAIVKQNGVIIDSITQAEVQGGHYGVLLKKGGKYTFEVKHAD